MLRLRLPGGRMTPSQWLAAETLSDQFGNGTLKLTTRQAIQIHGVVKQDLKQTMKDIHHAAITTIAASGDAARNVMVSLHPEDSGIHETVFNQARELSRKLEPQTHAYHEIWLDAKRIYSGAEEEPLYGPGYLPRKFKIAFTLPPENDVDVYAQDLSFVAIEKRENSWDMTSWPAEAWAMLTAIPVLSPALRILSDFVSRSRWRK